MALRHGRTLAAFPRLRMARFAAVGGACAVVQLGLFALLRETTALGDWSNVVAFALAGQLNFVLSSLLTWRDRRGAWRADARRLLLFNAMLVAGALVNQALYVAFAIAVWPLLAAALALAATSLTKYVLADRLIFAR